MGHGLVPILSFIVYAVAIALLALFGLHRYRILRLYHRVRNRSIESGPLPDPLPRVTVQLPIYNERYVVERLLDAVARLRYPRRLLQIQVLDDSTDATLEISRAHAERLRRRGFDIEVLHREDRTGFKAGALARGLHLASGEYVAIFDADFLPEPDFLLKTLGHFGDPRVGMVQVRWGHINRNYSLLTRLQAIFLDGHFVLEHTARHRTGHFFNFNGTAGIWRKSCIEEAGGWEHDTLTEDLDLSYRAQLCGWRFVYLPDVVSPAEVPVEMNAFKTQQHRWAKGSIQTSRKLLPRIWRAPLPLRVKLEATFHLTNNLAYLFMMVPALLILPLLMAKFFVAWYVLFAVYFTAFFATTASIAVYYLVSQREIHGDWKPSLRLIPALMSLGIGLSVNNARAVIDALLDRRSGFERTPKFGVSSSGESIRGRIYSGLRHPTAYLELLLGLYFAAALAYAVKVGFYGAVPFILIFLLGFLTVGLLSVLESRRRTVMAASWTVPLLALAVSITLL
jgi:cellulose synthase/poly-beta-1,6-N-acetylglucosamine synthase-like glycosyltransferase